MAIEQSIIPSHQGTWRRKYVLLNQLFKSKSPENRSIYVGAFTQVIVNVAPTNDIIISINGMTLELPVTRKEDVYIWITLFVIDKRHSAKTSNARIIFFFKTQIAFA